MSNGTASALERILACPSSHVMPSVQSTGPYAERGNAIAANVRDVIAGMSVADAAAKITNPDWRDTCAGIDWHRLTGDLYEVRGEIAYCINVNTQTARELGANIGRKYPVLGPDEIGGTVDIEGERLDAVPVVTDVKTGQDVTAAEFNPQIKFFALVKHILTGAPVVEGRIAYIAEDGSVRLDTHEFQAFDLQSYGDDLLDMVARVNRAREQVALGEVPPVSSGSHCKYCPAMVSCPRYTALAKIVAGEAQALAGPLPEKGTIEVKTGIIRERLAAMTQEQQAKAWILTKDSLRLLEMVEDALKDIARQAPIQLSYGKAVMETPTSTRRFSQAKAIELLAAKGATEEEIAAVYVTTQGTKVQAMNVAGSGWSRKKKAA